MGKNIVQVDADLEDLIPGYLQGRQDDVRAVEEALAQGDYEAIRVIGHTMKGTGGGYGFEAITDIGGALEAGAKAREDNEIRKGLAELRDYLDTLEVVYR